MKIFRTRKLYRIVVLVLLVVPCASCDVGKDEPGYSYMPDMTHSRAYETYSPNPNFSDSLSMRVPVEGTVPRGQVPYPYEKNQEDLELAGEIFKNPLEPATSIVQEGKMYFGRYCINCHGPEGKGQGNLITSRKYNVSPRDLTSEKIQNRKDGEIYHVITVGFGVMGAHGAIVQPDERWKIIHYIREELQEEE